jgi:hypothetical protein
MPLCTMRMARRPRVGVGQHAGKQGLAALPPLRERGRAPVHRKRKAALGLSAQCTQDIASKQRLARALFSMKAAIFAI